MNRLPLSIEVEFLASTTVHKALISAKDLAARLGVAYVKFDFNGTRFSVQQDADIEEALRQWDVGERKVIVV